MKAFAKGNGIPHKPSQPLPSFSTPGFNLKQGDVKTHSLVSSALVRSASASSDTSILLEPISLKRTSSELVESSPGAKCRSKRTKVARKDENKENKALGTMVGKDIAEHRVFHETSHMVTGNHQAYAILREVWCWFFVLYCSVIYKTLHSG